MYIKKHVGGKPYNSWVPQICPTNPVHGSSRITKLFRPSFNKTLVLVKSRV